MLEPGNICIRTKHGPEMSWRDVSTKMQSKGSLGRNRSIHFYPKKRPENISRRYSPPDHDHSRSRVDLGGTLSRSVFANLVMGWPLVLPFALMEGVQGCRGPQLAKATEGWVDVMENPTWKWKNHWKTMGKWWFSETLCVLLFGNQAWLARKSPNWMEVLIRTSLINGPFSSKPCLMTPEGINVSWAQIFWEPSGI